LADVIEKNETHTEEVVESNPRRKFIVIAVVLLLVIGASLFYWHSTFTESTDDAQVDGDLYQVSSRVTGQVIKVYVEDNQQVEAGQVLAEIDPKDYQVALEQAQANLASAQASAIQANVNVPITTVTTTTNVSTSSSDVEGAQAAVAQAQKQAQAAEARVAQAKANAVKSDLDVDRYTPLVQKDVISKQQYDGGHSPAGCRQPGATTALAVAFAGNRIRQERSRPGKGPASQSQRRRR
jgi:membrane fusion protein, multidrug efflux system